MVVCKVYHKSTERKDDMGNPLKQDNEAIAFYISTKGDDSHPGTINKPFATLDRAK